MGSNFHLIMSKQNGMTEEKLLDSPEESEPVVPCPSGTAPGSLGLAAGGVGLGTAAVGTTLGSLSYLSDRIWNPFYQNEKTEKNQKPEKSRLSKISLDMTKSIDSIKAGAYAVSGTISNQIRKLPAASGAMAQTLKGPATSITKLILVSILFCSIFISSYFVADAVQYRLNPDLELEELHFYLTADPSETRLPRLPEIFSTILALIATPLLAEKLIF